MIFYLLSSSFFFSDFTFYKEVSCFITFILSLCSNTLTLESIFECIRQKTLILKFYHGTKCLHVFISFFHPQMKFQPLSFCQGWVHPATKFQKSTQKNILILKFYHRTIPGWNFIRCLLTGMSSSRDEISSRQKRVNSKRHCTIGRNNFIRGRVSSWVEILRVNTLL